MVRNHTNWICLVLALSKLCDNATNSAITRRYDKILLTNMNSRLFVSLVVAPIWCIVSQLNALRLSTIASNNPASLIHINNNTQLYIKIGIVSKLLHILIVYISLIILHYRYNMKKREVPHMWQKYEGYYYEIAKYWRYNKLNNIIW